MLRDRCISVTDLRTKTKTCLADLGKKPKYIFMNNSPIAVLLAIDEYENTFRRSELIELSDREVDANLLKRASAARKLKKIVRPVI